MHPPDCPVFEYENVTGYDSVIRDRTETILRDLRQAALLGIELAVDTRATHGELFEGLTPIRCEYFAGHYRGEQFRCLLHYQVGVRNDPRVGSQPRRVAEEMSGLGSVIRSYIDDLDRRHRLPNSQCSPLLKLRSAVAVAAYVFERFLCIHPYANGNGHVARFVLWAVLVRYRYFPYSWRIHPRPDHPDYGRLIVSYRDGNPIPLQAELLRSIQSPLS